MTAWPFQLCQTPATRGCASCQASSSLGLAVSLAKRLIKEPWGCWHKGVLPLSQLAHLKYVLPAALPVSDGARRSEVIFLLLASFYRETTTLQSKLSGTSTEANHYKNHARRAEKCMQICLGWRKTIVVVKAGINECGLGKCMAFLWVDVFVFLTAPCSWQTLEK